MVTDLVGGAVIGATVTATDQDRGAAWPAATDADEGIYTFLRFVAPEINQRCRVDVVPQLDSVSESVEMLGETARCRRIPESLLWDGY